MRISSGISAIGHGGAGERSVGAGALAMERPVNSVISSEIVGGRAVSEWWAVFGTVTDALEGFGSMGFGAGKDEDGKCFFLKRS